MTRRQHVFLPRMSCFSVSLPEISIVYKLMQLLWKLNRCNVSNWAPIWIFSRTKAAGRQLNVLESVLGSFNSTEAHRDKKCGWVLKRELRGNTFLD